MTSHQPPTSLHRPRLYLIAGEASGDLHGANLIKALKAIHPLTDVRCWGGNHMQAAGATLVKHYKDLAFMGFVEVVTHLHTILKNLSFCKKDILAYKPDVVVLIDYPGFNLRIAKWAKQQGFRVVYYISPQVWAWKEKRVKAMRQYIDALLVILPFEKKYFKDKWNWDVTYVGHPLMEAVAQQKAKANNNWVLTNAHQQPVTQPIVALLPGSRKQEIAKKLPVMLAVSRQFPHHHFVVAQAPSIEEAFYTPFVQHYPNVSMVSNRTYDVLLQSVAALVTSGTATLETALLGVPEVVCYKGSAISYQIAKRIIHIKYISLVNLIMDKEVVKELIQDAMNVENITKELALLLYDADRKATLKKDYAQLTKMLSSEGSASAKAAAIIMNLVPQ